MNRPVAAPGLRVRLVIALTAVLAVNLGAGLPRVWAAVIPARTLPAAEDAAPLATRTPTQVVVYDRQSKATTLVSHDQNGRPGAGSSSWPSISENGSAIAFESDSRLTLDDANEASDVYLWSEATNQLQRLSAAPGGGPANGPSDAPSISADASAVAFESTATNLTADPGQQPTVSQVFAVEMASRTTVLVSSGANSAGSGSSGLPSLSANGSVVAFESSAANLVLGDTNSATDVFLRNLGTGATIRASISASGRQVGLASGRPSLSGDGGAVAFDSTSPGLVPNDTNGARDVFVRDLPPAAQVAPNPLAFGMVPLGTPLALSVTVTSIGWTPLTFSTSTIGGADPGDFALAGDGCTGQTLGTGGTCSIAILFVPTAVGARTATLSIADTALDTPQPVTLVGGVGAPQVLVNPAVGPPGIVVSVIGANFPPGALVALQWDRGISQRVLPAVVGPDGTFSTHLLVFPNDQLGPRQVIVTPSPGGPTFAQLSAPFLVVPGTLGPPAGGALSGGSSIHLVIRH